MRISDWSSDVCSSDLRFAITRGERGCQSFGPLDTRGLRPRTRDDRGRDLILPPPLSVHAECRAPAGRNQALVRQLKRTVSRHAHTNLRMTYIQPSAAPHNPQQHTPPYSYASTH